MEDQCLGWLDESYAAVAPKKLAAMVGQKPQTR
jgi:hypothetical protein